MQYFKKNVWLIWSLEQWLEKRDSREAGGRDPRWLPRLMLHILSSTPRALTQNNSYHSFWGRDEVWYHWISNKVLHAYEVHKRKGLKSITNLLMRQCSPTAYKICAKYHKPLYTPVRLILKIHTQRIFPCYMVSPELALYAQPSIKDLYQYSLLLTAVIHTKHLSRHLPAILVCVLQLLTASGLTNMTICTKASITPL